MWKTERREGRREHVAGDRDRKEIEDEGGKRGRREEEWEERERPVNRITYYM